MLALTRKVGEKVVIGDNITITVVAFEGNKVRLGFSAPSDVTIWRKEVKDKIDEEKHHENR